jgi:glycosyltransferase involved in cell wall biosynthesis
MKLCFVTRNIMKGDGQSRVNYEVVQEAIRQGHHITLLASNVAPDLQLSSLVNWIDISVKRWPTQLLSSLVFSWQSAAWLHHHRQDFDIVQVNGANTKEPAHVNAVHFVHSSWLRSPVHPWRLQRDFRGAYQLLYTTLNAYWEKIAFHQAKMVVAVSEKVKQELIDLGIPKERIRVILNGVDLREFSPGYNERAQFNLPNEVPLALFVGDIRTPRKNLDTVLRALVRLPELHLSIVGATEKSPYPQLARELDLADRVHFLGYRRDVSEIMKAVDFFVFPSRYEACTLVLLEAMATGLPVVTAATAGGAEIVTPDCGVVLHDSEDIEALVEALYKLAEDRQLRTRMGQYGREIAEMHSWVNMAQSYIGLFDELCKI